MSSRLVAKDSIAQILRENRPNISDSTIKTYVSILSTILSNINTGNQNPESFFKDNYEEIIEFVENNYPSPSGIKTRMAALISVCDDGSEESKVPIEKYREVMNVNADKQKQHYLSQELTPREEENWINYADIVSTLDLLKKNTNALLKGKDINTLPMNKIQDIQNYVILCLYVFIPPRRLIDYSEMKIKDYNPDTDNYITPDMKKLIFNKYKTVKKYNQQEIEIPSNLRKVLKKWIKVAEPAGNNLLFDRNKNKLTSSQLQHRLNNIFNGRKISVDMIRHSYTTNKYGSGISLDERVKDAHDMGHSLETQMEYVKLLK